MIKTAILVDGGFYRKRAAHLWGKKTPVQRSNELYAYCMAHIRDRATEQEPSRSLYRIFYYDCPPAEKVLFHPLRQQNVDLGKQQTYKWTNDLFNELKSKRKVALRLGYLSETFSGYQLSMSAVKELCSGKRTIKDLVDEDFKIGFSQKGVDMKIGLDIASLSYKKQVEQIVLISGDSDFVPAAKLARREGVDFILDPMWAKIRPDLYEHIDGLKSQWKPKIRETRQEEHGIIAESMVEYISLE